MRNSPVGNGNKNKPSNMQEIVLIGLNHKTAPIELRECMAFSSEETQTGIDDLKNAPFINEVFLLSTCNRVEILLTTDECPPAVQEIKKFISQRKNIPLKDFESALYIHREEAAVRHIFRVAGSLDSMVLGEPQILGQIKESYKLATSRKASGVVLNRLMHKTFFVAKRIRTETGIGDNAVSISYAAIELGRKIFGNLEGKTVLLIGAGEMAELAVEHLIHQNTKNIIVTNRTFERGLELAKRFNGKAVRFEEITDSLKIADIVISSTGAPDYVVFKQNVKEIMRHRRNSPIFFVDIAVPRDIDPSINRITNAYVYDIDDLKGVISENIEDRKKEALKAERIVDEAVIQFKNWRESLSVVPTIIELRNKIETIVKTELNKTLQTVNHSPDDSREAFNRMTQSIVNKILHDPTILLKSTGSHWNKSSYLDLIHKLFNLNPPKDE